jgi:hypothetical protein
MVEDNGTLFVGGRFRYFSPRVGAGVIAHAGTGANLTAALNINGPVISAIADGVGGWFIGGNFTKVAGQKRAGIARIGADGSLDPVFRPNVIYGSVRSMLLQGSTLYIGGTFENVNNITRRGLAALDLAGGLLSWEPLLQDASFVAVYAVEAFGTSIAFGGNFSSVNGTNRMGLAAVDANGNLDPWDPQLAGGGGCSQPRVEVLKASGSLLYVGGCFESVQGQPRQSLAAFGAAGTVTSLDAQMLPTSRVYGLDVSGSDLFVAGSFFQLGGASRSGLGAVNVASGLATPFNPSGPTFVSCIKAVGSTVYVGWGSDSPFGIGLSRSYAAAFNASNGALLAWDPQVTGGVQTLAESGGRVFAGGRFAGAGGGHMRSGVAALDTSGALLAWAPALTSTALPDVKSLSVMGGLVYVAGQHDGTATLYRPGLVAIDRFSGLAAPGFNASMSSFGPWVLTASASALYVGGSFSSAGGQPRNYLAALDLLSGSALPFRADANGTVDKLALGNNRLYAAGQFALLSNTARQALGAVDPDTGVIDAFSAGPIVMDSFGQTIQAFLPQGADIYVAGAFSSINGVSRRRLARLDPGGGVQAFDAQISADSWSGPNALIRYQDSLLAAGFHGGLQGYRREWLFQVDPDSGSLGAWRFKAADSGTQTSFSVLGSRLVMGGHFTFPDGVIGQHICFLSPGPDGTPDAYEPQDENYSGAVALVPGAPPIQRTFHDAFESTSGDVFAFSVVSGTSYTIETLNLQGGADPTLSLVHIPNYPDFTGYRILGLSDDRDPGDRNAWLEWTADLDGIVILSVSPADPADSGAGVAYSIQVSAALPGTPTVTPTPSPSPTETPSATGTATPSSSPTSTDTGTYTGTTSPTAMASLTATPTETPSGTGTASPSATPTASEAYSPTETPTGTLTSTATPASSATPSQTLTGTDSPTPTVSESPTVTLSYMDTPTPSATPSSTETPTASLTATPSPSVSATVTIAESPTVSPSFTASPNATETQTPGGPTVTSTTVVPDDGVVLLKVVAAPNPDPRRFFFELSGNASKIRWTVYTSAYTRVLESETGPMAGPWASIPAPLEFLSLPNGLYYIRASVQGGDGVWTQPKTAKVFRAR